MLLTSAIAFVSVALLTGLLGCNIERVDTDGKQIVDSSGTNKDGGTDKSSASTGDRPRVAYVTNGIASFWDVAAAGCKAAEEEFDVEVLLKMLKI